MPAPDLALLIAAARAAGEIALGFWGKSPRVWEKDGQGPVSEADIAVNDMLYKYLRAARPGYGWLSEETSDSADRLDCEYVFIIDPIDGTRSFLAGDRSFAHSLAVARNGQVTAACVYLPALDRLFSASENDPALCNGQAIRASGRADPEGATMMTAKANLEAQHWNGPAPAFARAFRPSIAHRLCLIADGSFDGLLSFSPVWEWDIAAGALIANRAGTRVSDCRNQPLRFNSPKAQSDGILAAAPALHAAVTTRMSL